MADLLGKYLDVLEHHDQDRSDDGGDGGNVYGDGADEVGDGGDGGGGDDVYDQYDYEDDDELEQYEGDDGDLYEPVYDGVNEVNGEGGEDQYGLIYDRLRQAFKQVESKPDVADVGGEDGEVNVVNEDDFEPAGPNEVDVGNEASNELAPTDQDQVSTFYDFFNTSVPH